MAGVGFVTMPKLTAFIVILLFVSSALAGEETTVSATATPAPSVTPTVSASVFSTVVPSPSITPFTEIGDTANLVIQLDITLQPSRKVMTNPLDAEIETVIAAYMSIGTNAIIVVSVSVNEQASVLICTGNIADFANALNSADPFFDGTVLEGATVPNIFWNVACQDPLDDLPSNSYWGGDDDDKSSYWTRSFLFDSDSDDEDSNGAARIAVATTLVTCLLALLL